MTPHASHKKLNEMNRLADMGHFPVAVNAGASFNVLVTITLTWLLIPHAPQPYAPVAWVALVLCLNLFLVSLIRRRKPAGALSRSRTGSKP